MIYKQSSYINVSNCRGCNWEINWCKKVKEIHENKDLIRSINAKRRWIEEIFSRWNRSCEKSTVNPIMWIEGIKFNNKWSLFQHIASIWMREWCNLFRFMDFCCFIVHLSRPVPANWVPELVRVEVYLKDRAAKSLVNEVKNICWKSVFTRVCILMKDNDWNS